MRKYFYLLAFVMLGFSGAVNANTGDTTWVQSFNGQFDHYGNYDTAVTFPNGTKSYRKIYLIFTMGEYTCPGNPQYCHQWDYTLTNTVMTPGGDTLELGRFISPYATSGTPGFGANWKQHYIFDVTDFYAVLQNAATMRILYSGYSWGYNGDVKFAFIEGTPERNVLGHDKLWDKTYQYGNVSAANTVIDSNLLPVTKTAPTGTQSAEMKFTISGHGADNTSGCCEFDNTGMGHTYDVVVNNNIVAQTNMNINCGISEIYPQGGTWLAPRNGNWCPGERVKMIQYKLPGVTAGSYTVDVNFDDSYNGGGSYGVYSISGTAFYYGPYNHTVDASVEDIIAPTTFEWYKRENPRASIPVIKVRNTGATTITSLLIEFGVKDSAMQRYIWTGSLASSHDTLITLPQVQALTTLSSSSASGTHTFVAHIVSVNGQEDADPSNDTLTSHFLVAPTWQSTFVVAMHTNNAGVSGINQNPSETSWQITNSSGAVVALRANANVNTTYLDTVVITSDGFYTLKVTDQGCDGLHWWYYDQTGGPTGGTFAIKDYFTGSNIPMNNYTYSGTFHDDFGCEFTQNFTIFTGNCSGIVPTIIRVGDTLVATPASSAYQWFYNGVLITGANQSILGMTHNNGNYSVRTTDGSNCASMSANFAVLNLGVNELYDFSKVSLAPNPTRDQFTLSVGAELLGTEYTISDLTGRKIITGNIMSEQSHLSIAGLSTGVYLLTIGAQNTHTFKIVKD